MSNIPKFLEDLDGSIFTTYNGGEKVNEEWDEYLDNNVSPYRYICVRVAKLLTYNKLRETPYTPNELLKEWDDIRGDKI